MLRKLFEKLGSTYVKLGQFIASSPTVFPAEYVREFQSCHLAVMAFLGVVAVARPVKRWISRS